MKNPSPGKNQSDFFKLALRGAARAAKRNEVPIGAVIVKDGKIISHAFNQTEKRKTFMAHAEMICIEKACRKLKTKYLNDCELYITLEPCLMCFTAAKLSRIGKIYYLLKSFKFGSRGKAYYGTRKEKVKSTMTRHAMEMLQDFFKQRR